MSWVSDYSNNLQELLDTAKQTNNSLAAKIIKGILGDFE